MYVIGCSLFESKPEEHILDTLCTHNCKFSWSHINIQFMLFLALWSSGISNKYLCKSIIIRFCSWRTDKANIQKLHTWKWYVFPAPPACDFLELLGESIEGATLTYNANYRGGSVASLRNFIKIDVLHRNVCKLVSLQYYCANMCVFGICI